MYGLFTLVIAVFRQRFNMTSFDNMYRDNNRMPVKPLCEERN